MSKTIQNKFTVSIPVKSYVKRFLEINYGNPVDLSLNAESHKFFRELLKKPSREYEKRIPEKCSHQQNVEVQIDSHDFYRWGWELTRTDTVAFGIHFENEAKLLMRNVIGCQVSLGRPFNASIKKFQKRFKFDEDTWPYESIYKDFYRNGSVNVIDFDNEIFDKIENIILLNLSKKRTLAEKALKYYEVSK